MTKKVLHLAAVLLGAATVVSCFDKSYDLDNIDLTIGSNADISLPLSSTGNILLRDLMGLEEDGIVQFITDEQGNEYFAVVQDGQADIAPIEIPEINIDPDLTGINTHIDLNVIIPVEEDVKKSGPRRIRINAQGITSEIEDAIYNYRITEEDNAKSEFNNAKTDVDKDVRSLTHIAIKENTATMEVHVDELPEWLEYFYMENGQLYLPAELEISKCVFTCYGEDGKTTVNNITNYQIDEARGYTLIPLTETRTKISARRGMKLEVTFTGASTGQHFVFQPDNAADGIKGTITATGCFEVRGDFDFNTADIDENKFNQWLTNNASPEAIQKIISDGSIQSIMPSEIHVVGDVSMPNIVVEKVTGTLQHEIAAIAPIRLDDMPDFLNDEDVVLDLDNPLILINAKSEMAATATTDITLGSIVGTTHNIVSAPGIEIKQGNNLYYISNGNSKFLPKEYQSAEKLNVTGQVSSLIKKIPEEITVSVAPVTLQAVDFDITKKYNLSVDYQIYAPLTMGEEFRMVYRDTERGWIDDLEDMDKLDIGKIEMKGLVDSNVPGQITLTLIPLDEYGQRIDALRINSEKAPAYAKNHEIKFTLEPAPGYTLNDALAGTNGVMRLDGMTYEARIDQPIKDETVQKNAQIRIHDIKTTLKGGIIYDAN